MKSRTASKISIILSLISIFSFILGMSILSNFYSPYGGTMAMGMLLLLGILLIIVLALIFSIISFFLKKENKSRDKRNSIISLVLAFLPIIWFFFRYLI